MSHELLTGRPPFPKGKAREIMNQHMTTPPISLRTLRPDIRSELDTIVLAMLAKKPDDRPDDADGLAATLLAALHLDRIAGRRPGPGHCVGTGRGPWDTGPGSEGHLPARHHHSPGGHRDYFPERHDLCLMTAGRLPSTLLSRTRRQKWAEYVCLG